MSIRTYLFASCIAASSLFTLAVSAQTAAAVAGKSGHTIIVKLVDRPDQTPRYGFDPAAFTAERGDTVEFVQAANVMHNVHFQKHPLGANLGRAAVSRYLSTKGQTYDVVIDSRFADGTYEIVCDPHSMMGMHAVLTVDEPGRAGSARR